MAYENLIPQRKNNAEGNGIMEGGNFGCKPMDHSKGPMMTPIAEAMKGHTTDGSKRGAAPPVGGGADKHARQAQPDHGPQGKRMSVMS